MTKEEKDKKASEPDATKGKKFSRIDAENLEAFQKYKEAFDSFDWNKTKTIATSVRNYKAIFCHQANNTFFSRKVSCQKLRHKTFFQDKIDQTIQKRALAFNYGLKFKYKQTNTNHPFI